MSKWIEADALISEMEEKHRPNFHEDLKAYHMWIMWYWALKKAPSIDIVRCKECRKANTEDCSHLYWDDDWGEWRVGGDEWFCADGERSEKE